MSPSLIAIMSCHKHRAWQDAQRQTWIKDIPAGPDYRFFLGNPRPESVCADEAFLDVPDDYDSLTHKIKGMIEWALGHGYGNMYKCDIDTLVSPVNLMGSGFERHDYVGRYYYNYPAPQFASGGSGYCLSERAMRLVVAEPTEGYPFEMLAEAVFVAWALIGSDILLQDDARYKYAPGSVLDKETISVHLSSTPGWHTPYAPEHMFVKYAEFKAL